VQTPTTMEMRAPTIAELEEMFRDKTQPRRSVNRLVWAWSYLAGLAKNKWTGQIQLTFHFNDGGVNHLRVNVLQEVKPD
jgi:hypothetical protein